MAEDTREDRKDEQTAAAQGEQSDAKSVPPVGSALAERLAKQFGDRLDEVTVPRARRVFVTASREVAKEVAEYLVKEASLTQISTITALDSGDRYEVIYHLWSDDPEEPTTINLRTSAPKDDPWVYSVTPALPGAVLYEREIMDLMGVMSKGHPDLRRLVLPEDFPEEAHPLRKDWKPRAAEGGES